MIITSTTENYISVVEKAIDIIKRYPTANDSTIELTNRILGIQADLNEKFFFTRSFSMLCYRQDEVQHALGDINTFIESVDIWISFIREILAMYFSSDNQLDSMFISLMNYYSISDSEHITDDMIYNLKSLPEVQMKYVCEWFSTRAYLWKNLDVNTQNYELIRDRVDTIKNHENDFMWLYDRLGDYRSKHVLFSVLKNWLTFKPIDIKDASFDEYRDLDLIGNLRDGVIVDCGAFDGDSAIFFKETYPNCGKIYCFEASPENYNKLCDNTKVFDDVVCIPKAVGEEFGTLSIGNDDVSASLIKGGDIIVDVVPIDEEIKEPISLVKMDIEGAEQGAINGMRQHILSEKPKMIICAYHGNHDIIEVPLLVDSIRDDYKLYLRYNGRDAFVPIDFSLYAI